jgi:hypothetical protein
METNDILNRIRLMMNYDSKKTLTENVLLLEDDSQLIPKIIDDLVTSTNNEGRGGFGTTMSAMRTAFDNIEKLKSGKSLEDINKGLSSKISAYKNLTSLLVGELENDNIGDLSQFIDKLNKVPGVKASYDWYNKDPNKKVVISYQPESNEKKQVPMEVNLKRIYDSSPECLRTLIYGKFSGKESNGKAEYSPKPTGDVKYGEGVFITFSNKLMYLFTVSPQIVYNMTTQKWANYSCDGDKIVYGNFGTIEEAIKSANNSTSGEKSSGTSKEKSGNKTPYPWKDSPSIADVQSGKATIVSGMKGDSVIEIQNLLNASGAKLNPDGKFGRRTYKALIAFQNKSGTTNQKGVVDADTYNKLKGGGGTDEFATTDVGGEFTDSQSATPVSQLVTPKSGEGTPEPQSAGEFT